MGAISEYRELQSYLRLTLRVVGKVSDPIETGEEFRLRCTATNVAPAPAPDTPRIHFRNTRVVLRQSSHAAPARGPALWLDLPESYLRAGESSSVEVDLVAMRPLSGLFEFVGGLEEVIDAWVTADLDPDAFFKLWSRPNAPATPPLPSAPPL